MSHLGAKPGRLVSVDMFETVLAQRNEAQARAKKMEDAIRRALGHHTPGCVGMTLAVREILVEGLH